MSPNSLGYVGFVLFGAAVHRLLPGKCRNYFLLGLSWLFYLLCAPKYFVLFLLTCTFSYYMALGMERFPEKKKLLLTIALLTDFGILVLFKYLQFFLSLPGWLGFPVWTIPKLVVPVGLSFYTFALTGYLMDVYRGKTQAERSYRDFSLFVGFFPAILSGPIGRSTHLLPQIRRHSTEEGTVRYSDVKAGVTRFLIGLFKKLLLADQLAVLVGTVYAAPGDFSGGQVLFAMVAYSLQIYCDFSSYSDMALGTARLFGIRLMENFDAPYFSSSIQEFWRRWHISLSTWFRDYLYFPLGGSWKGKLRTQVNVLIVFAVSGLWHGAAVKFIIWGLLNGVYQVLGSVFRPLGRRCRNLLKIGEKNPVLTGIKIILTFLLSTLAWVFFRADSCSHALLLLKQLTYGGGLLPLTAMGLSEKRLQVLGIGLIILALWDGLKKRFSLERRLNDTVFLRVAVWTALLLAVLCFGAYGTGYDAQEFVYFKF